VQESNPPIDVDASPSLRKITTKLMTICYLDERLTQAIPFEMGIFLPEITKRTFGE